LLLAATNLEAQSGVYDSTGVWTVKPYQTDLFIAGYNQGEHTSMSMMRVDKNLKLKWKLGFRDGTFNQIGDFQIVGERVVLTLLSGNSGNNSFDASMYLVVLGLDGKLMRKLKIGPSWGPTSSLLVEGSKAYFTYKNNNSIYHFVGTSDSTFFTSVDLVSGEVKKQYCDCGAFLPKLVLEVNDRFVTVGEHDSTRKANRRDQMLLMASQDSLTAQMVYSERYEDILAAFPYNKGVALLTKYYDITNSIGTGFLRLKILDTAGKVESQKDLNLFADKIGVLIEPVHSDGKDFILMVQKDPAVKRFSVLRLSPTGTISLENAYAIDVHEQWLRYYRVGNTSYVVTWKSMTSPQTLQKLPIPPTKQATPVQKAPVVKKYTATFKLTDEKGKPAAGAVVETFNTSTGERKRRSVDKYGVLKIDLAENEFDRTGHTIIYFHYKNYPVTNRLLKKDWTPITYKIKLSLKKEEDDKNIDARMDN
jgi:hypothetical protein